MLSYDNTRSERISVGVDGSLASRAAVRWAVAHARAGDAITLVHVWRPGPIGPYDGSPRRDDRAAAEHLALRELHHADALRHDPRIRLSSRVLTGDAAERLAAEDADLVVVGAGRRGRLAGRLLGSVSARVGRYSSVPVVVVPWPPTAGPAGTDAGGDAAASPREPLDSRARA